MVTEQFIPKTFTAVSRDRIDKANDVIQEYASQGYRLTLRQLYYQFVSRDWMPNTAKNYDNLGNLIKDARLAGLIDWDAIEDRGRVGQSNTHWASLTSILRASAEQFMYDRWTNQPCHVEVMVEKDALSGVLLPVCEELDVLFTANKGYSSSSYMYETAKRLSRHIDAGKDVHIIYLGDHDPSGLDMSRDIADRFATFQCTPLRVHRIALNMDQVERYEPPENPAKTTDTRYAAYREWYGPSSWELDALEPTVLSGLVRDSIRALIDTDAWTVALQREGAARDRLTAMANQYESDHGD